MPEESSVISIYEDGKVVKEPCGEWEPPKPPPPHEPRRKPFKFTMVGIKPGTVLTFAPTGIKVKVDSDDQVEYKGRIYKLSPFAGTFMPESMSNNSGAYQGAKYFSYNGQNLAKPVDVGNHLLRNRRLQNTVDAVSFFPLSLFIPGDLVTVLNQKLGQRNMGTFLFRAEFKRYSKFFSFRFCGKRFLPFTAAGIPQNPLCTVLSF